MTYDLGPFGEWLSARSLRTSGKALQPSTVQSKTSHIRQTMAMLETDDEHALAAWLSQRNTVEALLDRLYVKHSPATVRLDVQSLRDWGAFAVANGWLDKCYVESTDAPRFNNKPEVETYTQAEVDRLLLFAEVRGNLRFRLLLETVVATGCRIGELLVLKWDGVLLHAEPPHLHFTDTKSGRPLRAPLNERLRTLIWTDENVAKLRALPQNVRAKKHVSEYVFPLTYNTAHQSLARICELAGIPPRSWHCFRHTFATDLLRKGVPIHAVSRLLNHGNVAITDRYYAHDDALDYSHYLDE